MDRRAPIVFLLITCVLALSCVGVYALAGSGAKEDTPMPEAVVAVAADLHYLAPELTDHGVYFEDMIRHGDGKIMDYIEELTDAFVADMAALRPDALILAGDVTFNSALESHEALAAKLRPLADAGVPVLVLPGNHDLQNRNAARFHGDSFTRVQPAGPEDFARIYGSLGYDDALSRDAASLSYMYEISPELYALLIDVNVPGAGNVLLPETLVWAEAQLEAAAAAGATVLAVSHQNLLQHNSVIVSGYRMDGWEALLELYERYGVLTNLTGHLHCQHIAQSEGGFYEIATSALSVSPIAYGLLTLSEDGGRYETVPVDAAGWAEEQGRHDPALMDIQSYAREFFLASGDAQLPDELAGREDAAELAAFLGELNAAYFAGRMDTVDPDDPMFDRWREIGGFTPLYIESIREDGFADHTQLTLY